MYASIVLPQIELLHALQAADVTRKLLDAVMFCDDVAVEVVFVAKGCITADNRAFHRLKNKQTRLN